MHHFPAGVNSLDTRRPPPPPRRPRSSGLVFPERRVWAGCLPGAASLILAGILRSENYHPPAKTGRQGSGGAHTAACPGEAPASVNPVPPRPQAPLLCTPAPRCRSLPSRRLCPTPLLTTPHGSFLPVNIHGGPAACVACAAAPLASFPTERTRLFPPDRCFPKATPSASCGGAEPGLRGVRPGQVRGASPETFPLATDSPTYFPGHHMQCHRVNTARNKD